MTDGDQTAGTKIVLCSPSNAQKRKKTTAATTELFTQVSRAER